MSLATRNERIMPMFEQQLFTRVPTGKQLMVPIDLDDAMSVMYLCVQANKLRRITEITTARCTHGFLLEKPITVPIDLDLRIYNTYQCVNLSSVRGIREIPTTVD